MLLAAVAGCVAIGALMGISQFVKVLRVILPVVVLTLLASQLPVFSDAMESLTQRFSEATQGEGGSVENSVFLRTLQPAIDALDQSASSNNWMGIGIGRGAAAIATLLNEGDEFPAGETEFSRDLSEMGPIAGSAFLLFKLFLAIALLHGAVARAREDEPMALLMLPLAIFTLFWGVSEQPTYQGFMVLGVAFCLAAAKTPPIAMDRTLSPVQAYLLHAHRR
jgi:hypothetical protein